MAVAGDFIEQLKEIYGSQGPTVILDVGSRDLEESIQMSTAFPNTRIIAFEPNPNQFVICQAAGKNFRRHRRPQRPGSDGAASPPECQADGPGARAPGRCAAGGRVFTRRCRNLSPPDTVSARQAEPSGAQPHRAHRPRATRAA